MSENYFKCELLYNISTPGDLLNGYNNNGRNPVTSCTFTDGNHQLPEEHPCEYRIKDREDENVGTEWQICVKPENHPHIKCICPDGPDEFIGNTFGEAVFQRLGVPPSDDNRGKCKDFKE